MPLLCARRTMPLEYYQCNTNQAIAALCIADNRSQCYARENSNFRKMVCKRLGYSDVTGTILAPYWSDHEDTRGMGLMSTAEIDLASRRQSRRIIRRRPRPRIRRHSGATRSKRSSSPAFAAACAQSLETKREANAVVEALSAEDLGEFPNTNVAEAMTQVPGVAIDRRFGQGERVSIDGTDPSLNLTFLDGHPVAQSIWLFGEQPNRGFDQTQIASEIIGRIEIYKSPEARLPEGSLGGTVLMHTRRPLDLEANTVAASARRSTTTTRPRRRSRASPGCTAGRTPTETWGIAVAAQHYEEQVDRQGAEIFGYQPASTFPNVTGVDPDAQVPELRQRRLVPADARTRQRRAQSAVEAKRGAGVQPQRPVHQGRLRQLQPVDVQLPLADARRGRRADRRRRTASSPADIRGPTASCSTTTTCAIPSRRPRAWTCRVPSTAMAGRCRARSARARPTTTSSSGSSSRPLPAASAGTSAGASRSTIRPRRAIRRTGSRKDSSATTASSRPKPRTPTRRPISAWSSTACSTSCVSASRRHKHEEDFSLNVYRHSSRRRSGAGRNDRSHRYPGLCSDDHGQHVYAGRGNVLNWVSCGPAELRQSGCGQLPQQHLSTSSRPTLGLCAVELRQGRAPARQFRRSLREGRDRKHGLQPGERHAVAAGAPGMAGDAEERRRLRAALAQSRVRCHRRCRAALRCRQGRGLGAVQPDGAEYVPQRHHADRIGRQRGSRTVRVDQLQRLGRVVFRGRVGGGGIGVLQGHRQLHRDRRRHRAAVQFDQRRRRSADLR